MPLKFCSLGKCPNKRHLIPDNEYGYCEYHYERYKAGKTIKVYPIHFDLTLEEIKKEKAILEFRKKDSKYLLRNEENRHYT
jgi:hypothetical protein